MTGFSSALTTWCSESPRITSSRATTLAREAFVDTVACIASGAREDSTRRVFKAAEVFGGGSVTVAGQAQKLAPPGAALVNGMAAHLYDFDDNFHPAAAHASAVLVPAILALGEFRGIDGGASLDAYIVGLEAMARIGEAVNFDHYERGWHATSTIGSLGAAMAGGRVLGLESEQMHFALGLAFSMAGGTKHQYGAMAKPLHAGVAAQHGVMAALLASEGVSAVPAPLESSLGFRAMFAGEQAPGFDGIAETIGVELAIEQYGLMTKLYPNCASAHCTLDAVLALMKEHALDAGDIGRVDTWVPQVTADHLVFRVPDNEREARFSMHYAVGLAIEQGAMSLEDFRADSIRRSHIAAWAPRIEIHVDESVRPMPTPPNVLEPARVQLTLADGRTLEKEVRYARGVLENPMSSAERSAKFADCTEHCPGDAAALIAVVDSMETLGDIGQILGAV